MLFKSLGWENIVKVFLKEVSYVHQGCKNTVKYSYIVKYYYNLKSLFFTWTYFKM